MLLTRTGLAFSLNCLHPFWTSAYFSVIVMTTHYNSQRSPYEEECINKTLKKDSSRMPRYFNIPACFSLPLNSLNPLSKQQLLVLVVRNERKLVCPAPSKWCHADVVQQREGVQYSAPPGSTLNSTYSRFTQSHCCSRGHSGSVGLSCRF